MRRGLGVLMHAGRPRTEVGGRFLCALSGDLGGLWIVSWEAVDFGVYADDGSKVDGIIEWRLLLDDVVRLCQGHYGFANAFEDGRLTVNGPQQLRLKLARALRACAQIDLRRVFDEPGRFLLDRLTADRRGAAGVCTQPQHQRSLTCPISFQ